jgi:hypothetical protein
MVLGICLVALGSLVTGVICGAALAWWRYDSTLQAWQASNAELENQVLEAQRQAEELRADNIRLLDQKLSAS